MSTRGLLIGGAVSIGLTLVAAWIMRNSYWEEYTLPSSLQGEAAEDPYYAAKALVRELGGRVSEATLFSDPPTDSVIFLANWNWNLGRVRRQQLERWVEAGGRLVIDDSVYFLGDEFTAWSGISFDWLDDDEVPDSGEFTRDDCRLLRRQGRAVLADEGEEHSYLLCDFSTHAVIASQRPASWLLRDDFGTHVLRVPVGRGSVTQLGDSPFQWQQLLREDHPELFVAALQFRRGDQVQFLTEREYPSLLGLTWRFGWPAVVLALVTLSLTLWRSSNRFGPLLAPPAQGRRSLVEQIRGTGRFLLRHEGGGALLGASARALEAAARQHIAGFDALNRAQRIAAMAAATGSSEEQLAQAMAMPASASARNVTAAIAHLELLRHRFSTHQPRRTHGS